MQVIKITPRGYCYGVVDALQIAKRIARDPRVPRPIYVIGQIVHNQHAVDALTELGIVTLDGPDRATILDQVNRGTVIFTAHGVSPSVVQGALERGLNVVNATCPDVTKTHDLVKRVVEDGYEVIYVGKRGHPEPEGVVGEAPDHVHLVETAEDVDRLGLGSDRIVVTTQTTLSQWDTQRVIDRVRERYPHAVVHNDICLATQERQEAAVSQGRDTDVVLVVGDTRSNNSNRLVEVVREPAGRPAYLIDSVADIQPAWLTGVQRVGVTAGSSTPSELTRAVIQHLEKLALEVTTVGD